MKAMIKVNYHTASTIWRYGDMELYVLYDDGTEGTFNEDVDSLPDDRQYGIEGELFGEPYAEACDWFINNATTPSWCCNTHMYDGTGDYPSTGNHPVKCPFSTLNEEE